METTQTPEKPNQLAIDRIREELRELQKTENHNFKVTLPNESYVFHWQATYSSLKESPILLDILIPTDYPLQPPIVHVKT